MRITEFHVDGFGRLSNLSMTDVPPGLSIVLGQNEAGKTTLLEFLRFIMFGLPARKQKDFYPPLQGGRKGGRIVLRNEQSERFIVERCEGKGNGPLTVTMPDGSQGGEEQFRQLIGSATDELYRSVFAFSLSELQRFDSLQTEKVRDAIYSAGIGTGRRTIPQVLQDLKKQAEDLFVPGGSKPVMNRLLSRIEEHGRLIKSHEKDQDEYQRIQSDLTTCEASLRCIGSELSDARRRFERMRILQQAWPDWLTLGDCREQLATLPLIEAFPVDGIKRLDELSTERRGYRDQLNETIAQLENDQASIAAIHVDAVLLNASQEIRRLDRGLELHETNRQTQLTLATECGLAEQKLRGMLRDLGDEWDEHKLAEFDLSAPAQQEVEKCRRMCAEANDALRERKLEWELAQKKQAEDRRLEDAARSKLEALCRPLTALDADGIRKLQLGWQSYESAQNDQRRVEPHCETRITHLFDTLRKIGSHWTENRLREFDTSLAVQEQVSEHQRKLAELRSEVQDSVRRDQESQQSHIDAQADVTRAEAVLAAIPQCEATDAAELADRQRSLRVLRSQLNDVELRQARLVHRKERTRDVDAQLARLCEAIDRQSFGLPAWVVPVICLTGVFGLLGLGIGRGEWVSGGLVFGVLVIMAVTLFVVLRPFASRTAKEHADRKRTINDLEDRHQQLTQESQDAERELAESHNAWRAQTQRLNFETIPDRQALDEAEASVERQLAVWQQRQPAEQQRDEAHAALVKAQAALDRATKTETEQTKLLDAAQSNWRLWLANVELPVTLTPENAITVLGRLDAAREQLKAIDSDRVRIVQMTATMQEYDERLKAVATISGVLPELPQDPREAMQFLVARLEVQESNAQAVAEAERGLAESVKKTAQARSITEQAATVFQSALAAEQTCQRQWSDLRQRLGLRDSLAEESAAQMLRSIERARDQLAQVHDLRKREETAKAVIESYVLSVRTVRKSLGRGETTNADVSKTVSDWVTELDRAEDAQRRRESLLGSIEHLASRQKLLDRQIEQRQSEINEFLQTARATDEESFRRMAADDETRRSLDQQIRQLESRLMQLAGGTHAVQNLKDELADTTPENVNTERNGLKETIESQERQQTDAADERGRLKIQLEQLEESDEVSRLRIEQQADRAEFATNAEEWSILKIATHLIDRAREKYERERRPGVLKEAERYFSHFTNGNYTEILAPSGGDQVVVLTPDGSRKEISQLSRGTAEQLYLSLRFGFVQSFVGRSEPLPLVFDDILVNFDAGRARATVEAILELSKSLQILLFTCHSTTVDLMRSVDPRIPVFVLSDGNVTPAGSEK